MYGPAALLGELYQACAVILDHHRIRPITAAAGRAEHFALQVAVPPKGFVRIGCRALLYHFALAVVEIGQQGEYLITLVGGIDINATAAAHVIDRRQIPLLDVLTRAGIIEHLSQEIALLDGKDLHSGTFGVDVGHVETVAVGDAGAVDHALDGIDAETALQHLVDAVAVGIGHAQLMKLSSTGCLVVAAPGVAVMPIGGLASYPIILPCHHIIMVAVGLATVIGLYGQSRMDAVEIADDKL